MKKILLFALPLLAMIAVSCQKDSKTYSGPTKLVKEIWIESDGEKWLAHSFTYDNENRVYSTHNDGPYFTYTDNTIMESYDDSYKIYKLDANGYIIKSEDYMSSEESGKPTSTYTYIYSDGFLSSTPLGSKYVWNNGNIKSSSEGITYEYINIENCTNIDLGFCCFEGEASTLILPFKWKGLCCKNLVSKAKSNDGVINFEYTLDKDGAPTKIKVSYDDGSYLVTITYVE